MQDKPSSSTFSMLVAQLGTVITIQSPFQVCTSYFLDKRMYPFLKNLIDFGNVTIFTGYLGLINGGIFLYTNIYCGLLCNSKQEIEAG